jgi:hypothetical protein
MELKDLLPILFERFNAATTLWNLLVTVLLGFFVFVGAGPSALKS